MNFAALNIFIPVSFAPITELISSIKKDPGKYLSIAGCLSSFIFNLYIFLKTAGNVFFVNIGGRNAPFGITLLFTVRILYMLLRTGIMPPQE